MSAAVRPCSAFTTVAASSDVPKVAYRRDPHAAAEAEQRVVDARQLVGDAGDGGCHRRVRVHDGAGVEVAVDGEVQRQLGRRQQWAVDERAVEVDDRQLVLGELREPRPGRGDEDELARPRAHVAGRPDHEAGSGELPAGLNDPGPEPVNPLSHRCLQATGCLHDHDPSPVYRRNAVPALTPTAQWSRAGPPGARVGGHLRVEASPSGGLSVGRWCPAFVNGRDEEVRAPTSRGASFAAGRPGRRRGESDRSAGGMGLARCHGERLGTHRSPPVRCSAARTVGVSLRVPTMMTRGGGETRSRVGITTTPGPARG